jgi:hypothetical protein
LAVPHKSPMGKGQFGPHRPQSPLLIPFSPYAFAPMSPLCGQSTIFLQSELTEEINSELFWIDGIVGSAFNEDALRLFEGVTTALDSPPAFPNVQLLPSFEDDHLGPPPAQSGDGDHIDMAGFTANVSSLSLGAGSDDLYVTFSLSPYPLFTRPSTIASILHIKPPTEDCSLMTGTPV